MKILIIKHGALGDFILSLPAISAIRQTYPNAKLTLLTNKLYAPFGEVCPWIDEVLVDVRPSVWDLPGLWRLRRQLSGFDLVFDLQTSSRSSRYFALAGRPEWSGIAKGCALPHRDPNRDHIHTRERLAGQLKDAGIAVVPMPDLSWLAQTNVRRFDLPEAFTVLVPGAAAHRPEKRWPAAYFAEIVSKLPYPAVLVGAKGEAAGIPGLDLTGRTSLLQLAAIIARAKLAIGNDTGPMHLAAAFGVPSIVLFSAASDPAITAPRYPDGGWPQILRAASLHELPVAQVLGALP